LQVPFRRRDTLRPLPQFTAAHAAAPQVRRSARRSGPQMQFEVFGMVYG